MVVLHGGPGGGSSPTLRRFHDPLHYRIVTFDQRGCGRSTPHAELEQNTTWDLVADMEVLRHHLKIDSWQVFGGSWGSTLALAYALTHPAAVRQLILRGIFTVRKSEIDWFYQHGASMLFPEQWESYVAPIPEEERHDLVAAHHRRLTGADRDLRLASPGRGPNGRGRRSRSCRTPPARPPSARTSSPSPLPRSNATTSSTAASFPRMAG